MLDVCRQLITHDCWAQFTLGKKNPRHRQAVAEMLESDEINAHRGGCAVKAKSVVAAMLSVLGMLAVQSIAVAEPPIKIDLDKSSNIFNLGPPSSADNKPTTKAGPPPSPVKALESKLSEAASYAELAEYKARLQDETEDLSWRTLGHGTGRDDSSAYGDAYAKSYEEGKAACDAWIAGKPAKVKVAAKIYCSMWKSTLHARAEAHAHHQDFASTAAGAQFTRAEAELEAAAEE